MSVYVHGDNLEQKENHPTKYRDDSFKTVFKEDKDKIIMNGKQQIYLFMDQ